MRFIVLHIPLILDVKVFTLDDIHVTNSMHVMIARQ